MHVTMNSRATAVDLQFLRRYNDTSTYSQLRMSLLQLCMSSVPKSGRGCIFLREDDLDIDVGCGSSSSASLYAICFFDNGKMRRHDEYGRCIHRCVSIAPLVRRSPALQVAFDGMPKVVILSSIPDDSSVRLHESIESKIVADALDMHHLERFMLLCAQPAAFESLSAAKLEADDCHATDRRAPLPMPGMGPSMDEPASSMLPKPKIPQDEAERRLGDIRKRAVDLQVESMLRDSAAAGGQARAGGGVGGSAD